MVQYTSVQDSVIRNRDMNDKEVKCRMSGQMRPIWLFLRQLLGLNSRPNSA